MNTDIRLQMSFYNNTKVKRLKRVLGADAVLSLIFLWLYTAENRPHGELRGMDEIDIAVAAQWSDDPAEFVAALCDLGFLDKKRSLFSVHDWKNNNPWACDAPARSEKAKNAAKAKWAKKNGNKVCCEQNLAVLNDASSYAPSPSPFPSPKKKELSEFEKERLDFFEAAWGLYPRKIGKPSALKHYLKTVKTDNDINRINDALGAYLKEIKGEDPKYIKHGSTWFNNWQDWEPTDGN